MTRVVLSGRRLALLLLARRRVAQPLREREPRKREHERDEQRAGRERAHHEPELLVEASSRAARAEMSAASGALGASRAYSR